MNRKKGHINFEPGIIYVIYGELSEVLARAQASGRYHASYNRLPMYAYKIGMTKKTPQRRIHSAKAEVWTFDRNLQVVHTINVDNMRVAEVMFHQRYDHRKVIGNPNASVWEWFSIDDKIAGLKLCREINVMPGLQDLAGRNDPGLWWWSLEPFERRQYAIDLWKHPLVEIGITHPQTTRERG